MPNRRWGKATTTNSREDCALSQANPQLCFSAPGECIKDLSAGDSFDIDVARPSRSIAGSGRWRNTVTEQRCRFKERGETHNVMLSLTDSLPPPSLPPCAIEYHLQLRAKWLMRQGWNRDDAARELCRHIHWLENVWRQPAEQLQRPHSVAKYIAAYEQRMLQAGVEPFKSPSLRRRYVGNCAGIYEQCSAAFPWEQAVLRKRNYTTGEVTITDIASSRQDCTFPSLVTGVARVDAAVKAVHRDLNIRDPGAYLVCNWYPDGDTSIAAHEHDFWSAIISFGASRVFLLDNEPVLLGEGDLLVFGTQKHSVPRMPDVQEGRVSVAIFWYPERAQADGSFAITLDPLLAEAALANNYLAEAIAEKVAAEVARVPLDLAGRGVGRRRGDVPGANEDGFLSEDRIVAIALKVSMLEQ